MSCFLCVSACLVYPILDFWIKDCYFEFTPRLLASLVCLSWQNTGPNSKRHLPALFSGFCKFFLFTCFFFSRGMEVAARHSAHCLAQRFSTPVLAPPCSAHFACLCCLNTPDSDHQLIRRKFHEWTVFQLTCSLHSVHCSLLPKHEKSVDVYFTSELIYSLIYSRICAMPASSHTDETY